MTAGVSVVIPCFNHGRFLREAIDSVAGSTLPDAEIVVVDDGSTDDTAAVARSYGARVRLVQQGNRGLSAARNAGIAVAQGRLLHFLDADDRIDPQFLARMAQAADQHPDAAVFCGGWRLVDAANRPFATGSVCFPADPYRFLLGGNPMPCHAVVVRSTAIAAVGPFDESLGALEDWDLWLRLARAGQRFVAVAGASVDYRRHPGSMSRDVGRMLAAARTVLARHRGHHARARWRGMRAIRFGQYCENVLPEVRRSGIGSLGRALLRHPALLESALLHGLFALCPPLRRRLRVSELPFAAGQAAGPGDRS